MWRTLQAWQIYFMTVKEMSTDIDKTSKKSCFSVSSLLVRTLIYSGFLAGLIASFYDFKFNTFVRLMLSGAPSSEAIERISSINQAQIAYHDKNKKFSDFIVEVDNLFFSVTNKRGRDNYRYLIFSSMNPVQTWDNHREPAQFESAIALALPIDEKEELMYGTSYIGAVFAFKKDVSNQITKISVICKSDDAGRHMTSDYSHLPTFDGTETHCPPSTTILR